MNFYTKRRPKPVLQIISMIDLLIVLLIFLVVSTSFKEATNHLQLNLPQSSTGKGGTEATPRLPLIVTKDEQLMLGNEPIVMENLANAIRKARASRPDVKLALKIDKNVKFGVSVQILDALREAGCKADEYSILTAKP